MPIKLISWFQIPASNLDRAIRFYRDVLNASFTNVQNETGKHAFFAVDDLNGERTGGEIVQAPKTKPSTDGVIVYLNAHGGLDSALARVAKAGGKILLPKT